MSKRLNEIVLLRPFAIFLVVFYHSFAIYDGKWALPLGVEASATYDWIADFAYSFMLPLFVLISGYLFSYQLYEKNRIKSFKELFLNKVRRLLLPCYIFGFLYLIIIIQPCIVDIKTCFQNILDLLSGVGHLWFLTMLFWCFIAVYAMIKVGIPHRTMLLVSFIIYFVGPKSLPLGLGYTCWYLVYFVLGMTFRRQQVFLRETIDNYKVLVTILFLCSFVFINFIMNNFDIIIGDIKYSNMIHYLLFKAGTLVYGSLGCLISFLIAFKIVNNKISLPSSIIRLDIISFGVYIYHQFILKTLYYTTSFPKINTPLLPWIAFVCVIMLSSFLTIITRRVKIGRVLIG